jgi:acyl-CoA synthetase (AMP-forming)/AMP-acid ligase II
MSEDQPTSLLDIAQRRVMRDPSTPLLLTLGDGEARTYSYAEVLSAAERLAEAVAGARVGRGDTVGCYLSNAPSWVVSSLAAWLNGAAVAAVGTLLPSAEASALFELAETKVVIAAVDSPHLAPGLTSIPIDEAGRTLETGDQGAGGSQCPALPNADDLAVVIFTSGTTGHHKGITHTHGDIVAASRRVAAAYARTSDYRPEPAPAGLPPGVIFNPFGHMAGYSRLAFRMWIGRPTVLIPKFTVAAVKALLELYPMDTLQLTPAMVHMLATTQEELSLDSVKYVTSGTAPLSIDTRDRFETRFGIPVMQAYGMSELGAVAQERYDDVVAGRRGPGSVGRLASGVEVRIDRLDDDRPAGEGEIHVRTDEASTSFLGGARVPMDDEGWFATGDVGRIDDDILYVTGRVHEKMIVGGFNVYPAEVEDAVRRSSLVNDAVVVSVDDDRLGERPVAGIVWAGEPDERALLAELRGWLAPYKIPRATFAIEAVPLTPRDKIDRARGAQLAREALEQGIEHRTGGST